MLFAHWLSRWWHTQLLSLKERQEKKTKHHDAVAPNRWPAQHSISPHWRTYRWSPGIWGSQKPLPKCTWEKRQVDIAAKTKHCQIRSSLCQRGKSFSTPCPSAISQNLAGAGQCRFSAMGGGGTLEEEERGNQQHLPSSAVGGRNWERKKNA